MAKATLTRKEFLKLAGAALAGGLLAACAPEIGEPTALSETATIAPEATSTEIPTATTTATPPNPTSTPQPTPTATKIPTQEPTAAEEEGSRDILTDVQKERLQAAAMKYIAKTETDAIQVARSLGYLKNDGHPASVCGPLAIAILREAGLISPYVDLHDYWLLNPRDSKNQRALEMTFPRDEFSWFRTSESTADFDFKAYPLKAGDFLYLYAGNSGSFEHMLTVSRVDEAGRAYSVTNFNTPDGYVIEEVMLYDPSQPGVGKLYDWTDYRNWRYGRTGYGGFNLWRFSTPVLDPSPAEQVLAKAIDGIIAKNGGNWYLLIREIPARPIYRRRIRTAVHPASVIKVPITMLFFKWLESGYPGRLKENLQDGFEGRTFEQLIEAMLVNSEEEATESILRVLERARFDLTKQLSEWGASATDVKRRISSASDMAVLFEGLYGKFLSEEAREIILQAMSVYTPGDDTRWGVLRKKLPEGYHFYNKRGTLTDDFLDVGDWAIIECPTTTGKRTFVLGAFAFQGDPKTTYESLVGGVEEIAGMFWDYVQTL
jgi:hypothetical protein